MSLQSPVFFLLCSYLPPCVFDRYCMHPFSYFSLLFYSLKNRKKLLLAYQKVLCFLSYPPCFVSGAVKELFWFCSVFPPILYRVILSIHLSDKQSNTNRENLPPIPLQMWTEFYSIEQNSAADRIASTVRSGDAKQPAEGSFFLRRAVFWFT